MTRSLSRVGCAVALLSLPALASASLLINGDLELPAPPPSESDLATGWTLVEPDVDSMGTAVNSATFVDFGDASNHTPGGDRGLWFRSFEGGLGGDLPFTVNATLRQDVPATPGTNYSLSAWFRYEDNYSGLNPAAPTQTHLFIEFLDAGNMLISGAMLDIDTVQTGDRMWRQFSVNAFAPANAATIRVGARMIDGVLSPANPQSAFVDDFVLVPAPAALFAPALACLGALRRRRV